MSELRPRFSIVVPAYNAAPYIADTISSVRAQDFDDYEMIVVDGASTDRTVDVVNSVADARIRVIAGPDDGQLDAVQKGLKAARGDIVHWLNADDIMMPGTLTYVSECFTRNSAVQVVFSDDYAFSQDSRKLHVGATIRGLTNREHVLFYRQMYSECIYWRRECTKYLDPDFYSLRVYTDYAFFGNLCEGLKLMWVPKRLGAFRITSGQASQRYAERKKAEFRLVRRALYRSRGWSRLAVICLRLNAFPLFALRQKLFPTIERMLRRLWRFVENDRTRTRNTDIFFDRWLGNTIAPEAARELFR